MKRYSLSGDGSGKTFGVYEADELDYSPYGAKLVQSGLTMEEARKEIRRLEKEQRE